MKYLNIGLFFLLLSNGVFAVVDVFEFNGDDERARYMKFVDELRCPKCKNQNLAGSNSPIALDLRRELHRLIDEGKSDEEIVDFMVARFGDFVLYDPPVQKNTYLLWIAPFIMGCIGLLVVFFIVLSKRRSRSDTVELSDNEETAFEDLRRKIAKKKNSDQ